MVATLKKKRKCKGKREGSVSKTEMIEFRQNHHGYFKYSTWKNTISSDTYK